MRSFSYGPFRTVLLGMLESGFLIFGSHRFREADRFFLRVRRWTLFVLLRFPFLHLLAVSAEGLVHGGFFVVAVEAEGGEVFGFV